MSIVQHVKTFIMEVIGHGQEQNLGKMFLIEWNISAEDTIKRNKSCISLAIVHSKGILLIKPYFDHIGGVPHSVDNNRYDLNLCENLI